MQTQTLRFIDLFAGLGGFHVALSALGHECVFASELDDELREAYKLNFPKAANLTFGDIRDHRNQVPPHDVLCAGFPCQPFSKSGSQKGRGDDRGTLFDEIAWILKRHQPRYVLLENVGNFERHDGGATWVHVQESLKGLGYDYIYATTHFSSGGSGLLSPHHIGHPQHRERFFCVATRTPLTTDPFPPRMRRRVTSLLAILQPECELTAIDRLETQLSDQQRACVDHWNRFLAQIPPEVRLPSFPIWGEELRATYPLEGPVPRDLPTDQLLRHASAHGPVPADAGREELLAMLPSYARDDSFPAWKLAFIKQNRDWLGRIRQHLSPEWVEKLWSFPASFRKLEWNCQGEPRDLWQHVLQFRPSGLRVKRMTSAPALVAMTNTQIPLVGPRGRFLSREEGLALQGFPRTHQLPERRARAFKALGNAVHVKVVQAIVERMTKIEVADEPSQPMELSDSAPSKARSSRTASVTVPVLV
jgi:DNA (cytosine-5)-methyltransferase 1